MPVLPTHELVKTLENAAKSAAEIRRQAQAAQTGQAEAAPAPIPTSTATPAPKA